jgi:hypothetical protein
MIASESARPVFLANSSTRWAVSVIVFSVFLAGARAKASWYGIART